MPEFSDRYILKCSEYRIIQRLMCNPVQQQLREKNYNLLALWNAQILWNICQESTLAQTHGVYLLEKWTLCLEFN